MVIAQRGPVMTIPSQCLILDRVDQIGSSSPRPDTLIGRILKHGEQGAAKTAHELFPVAASLGQSIPRLQEPRHAIREIVRELLQLRHGAALIKNRPI